MTIKRPDFEQLRKSGKLSMKEIQRLVNELETHKGFGHALHKKIMWMGEEYGELIHAYKHADRHKIVEECVDVLFFVGSILAIMKADGDAEFIDKLERNWGREAVVKNGEFHFDKN